MMMIPSALTALAVASGVLAATFTVQVGQGTNLVFSPNTISASPGDTITFNFGSSIPHSVTQSTFDDPCSKSTNSSAFDSGVKTSGTATYTVQDTNPVWLFCTEPGHCKGGMVAAINAPTNGSETFQAFQAKAEGVTLSSSSSSSSASHTSTGTTTSSSSSAPKSTTSKAGAAGRSISISSISSLGFLGGMATVAVVIGSVAVGASLL